MPSHVSDTVLGLGKLPGELLGTLLGSLGSSSDVLVGPGIGRDAAAVRIGDQILVLKTDPITFATSGAGKYLINVNANDLACLGATPRWMLVTAMFPEGTTQDEVAASFSDLATAANERGITLVGGHTEITTSVTRPVLVGMLAGIATDKTFLHPGGAKLGDQLILSRPIAIEGTALLASELPDTLTRLAGAEIVRQAAALIDSPGISVAADAEVTLATGVVHALHDPTEGGVAMGAREIAEASGLAIELDRDAVPLLPETIIFAESLALDPLGMLASGSLLIACAAEQTSAVLHALRDSGSSPAIIGRFVNAASGHSMIVGAERTALPEFQCDEVSRALNALPAD